MAHSLVMTGARLTELGNRTKFDVKNLQQLPRKVSRKEFGSVKCFPVSKPKYLQNYIAPVFLSTKVTERRKGR